jgi:hypothetical protein
MRRNVEEEADEVGKKGVVHRKKPQRTKYNNLRTIREERRKLRGLSEKSCYAFEGYDEAHEGWTVDYEMEF